MPYAKAMFHHLLKALPPDVLVISVGEKAHELLPEMMDGSDLMPFNNVQLPHPSHTYTGRLAATAGWISGCKYVESSYYSDGRR